MKSYSVSRFDPFTRIILYSAVGLKTGLSEINIKKSPGGFIVAVKIAVGIDTFTDGTSPPVSTTLHVLAIEMKSTSVFNEPEGVIPVLMSTIIGG